MPYRHEINTDNPVISPPRTTGIEVGPVFIPPPPGFDPTPTPTRVEPPALNKTEQQLEQMIFEKSWQRVYDVFVYRCECQRCPKVWFTIQQTPPKTCPECRSAWWNRPYRPSSRPADDPTSTKRKKKKAKRGPVVPGRGRGRPRKYAIEEVPTEWAAKAQMAREEALPEIPVELLGTVDRPADAPNPSNLGATPNHEEDFPVPTPLDGRPSVPAVPATVSHTSVPTGQSPHGRISQAPTNPGGYTVGPDLTLQPAPEKDTTGVEPPPLPSWQDDDDWHPS